MIGKNVYAMVALVALGGVIVVGIYTAGVRHEQRKWALQMAETNKPIVEQRGKDEAELSAASAANAVSDAATSAAIAQMCILTPETAVLLARVR